MHILKLYIYETIERILTETATVSEDYDYDYKMNYLKNKENHHLLKTRLLGDKRVTSDHIGVAIRDEHPKVREAAASHPKATHEHISKALDDSEHSVRAAAAKNKNANTDHIEKALNDSHHTVRTSAVSNPKISKKQLDRAVNDDHPTVAKIAGSARYSKLPDQKDTTKHSSEHPANNHTHMLQFHNNAKPHIGSHGDADDFHASHRLSQAQKYYTQKRKTSYRDNSSDIRHAPMKHEGDTIHHIVHDKRNDYNIGSVHHTFTGSKEALEKYKKKHEIKSDVVPNSKKHRV